MSEFTILEGTSGLRLSDVAHIIVPGRGRDRTGRRLSAASLARVEHAAALYAEIGPPGHLVCSGYRTPGDLHGGEWTPSPEDGQTYIGVPEADSMRTVLLARGVPESVIRVERHSIDSVTNLVRAEVEDHFGDHRPVAVVAQRSHLSRIVEIIAPKVLRRDYLGVVVPEDSHSDVDGTLPRIVSRAVLFGVNTRSDDLIAITDRRVSRIWKLAGRLRVSNYHTDYR